MPFSYVLVMSDNGEYNNKLNLVSEITMMLHSRQPDSNSYSSAAIF